MNFTETKSAVKGIYQDAQGHKRTEKRALSGQHGGQKLDHFGHRFLAPEFA
jgi:hypothetical protein